MEWIRKLIPDREGSHEQPLPGHDPGLDGFTADLTADRRDQLSFGTWRSQLEGASDFESYWDALRVAPMRDYPEEVATYIIDVALPSFRNKQEPDLPYAGPYTDELYVGAYESLEHAMLSTVVHVGSELYTMSEEERLRVSGQYKRVLDAVMMRATDIQSYTSGVSNDDPTKDSWEFGWGIAEVGEDTGHVESTIEDALRYYKFLRYSVFDPSDFDTVISLVETHATGRYTREIATILSHMEQPSVGAHLFLSRLHASQDESVRDTYSRILHRVELGRIGVTDNVITYLEKRFILPEDEAKRVDFAQRITVDGKIGVFGASGRLEGYIEVGALDDSVLEQQVRILEVTRDMLFSATDDPDGRLTALQNEFQKTYDEFSKNVFGRDVGGMSMGDLSLREQIWLFNYWSTECNKDTNGTQWQRALTLKTTYGVDGVRSFISLEDDRENGNRILAIGESRPDHAQAVFRKYAEIVSAVERIRIYLVENFKREKISDKNVHAIVHMLLTQGAELMSTYSKTVDSQADSTEPTTIVDELHRINIQVLTFGSVLSQLSRDTISQLHLEEIPVIEKIQDITGSELCERPDLLEPILEIIRKQFPAGDDAVFRREIEDDPSIRCTISMLEGQVLSFFTKKTIGNNVDYVDWFISNPDAPIKGLGEATIQLGFRYDLQEGRAYYAVAKPHVKSFLISIERLGFVAFAGSTEDGEYKHHYARLSRLPDDGSFFAKAMDAEKKEVFRQAVASACPSEHQMQTLLFEGATFDVCKVVFSESISHQDDVSKDDPDGWIMSAIEQQYGHGKVLTSFLPERSDSANTTYYAVFEKDNNNTQRMHVQEASRHAA
jgi:hypothetical protein